VEFTFKLWKTEVEARDGKLVLQPGSKPMVSFNPSPGF